MDNNNKFKLALGVSIIAHAFILIVPQIDLSKKEMPQLKVVLRNVEVIKTNELVKDVVKLSDDIKVKPIKKQQNKNNVVEKTGKIAKQSEALKTNTINKMESSVIATDKPSTNTVQKIYNSESDLNEKAKILKEVDVRSNEELRELNKLATDEFEKAKKAAKLASANPKLQDKIKDLDSQITALMNAKHDGMKSYEVHAKANEVSRLAYEKCAANIQSKTYEGIMWEYRTNPENFNDPQFSEKTVAMFSKKEFKKDLSFTYRHIEDEEWLKERISNHMNKARHYLKEVYDLEITSFNQPNLKDDLLNAALQARTMSRKNGGSNDVNAAKGEEYAKYLLTVAGLSNEEALDKLVKIEKLSLLERGKDMFYATTSNKEGDGYLSQTAKCNDEAEWAKKGYFYK